MTTTPPGSSTGQAGTAARRDAVLQPLTAHDPRTVSGYSLRARIGEGGMGAVYLSSTPGGRPLAFKVVRPELAADPHFRRRFAQEVAIAQRVQGPFTVPVVDCDAEAALPWIATAYVAAPSLSVAVARRGSLPPQTVLRLTAGVAEALQSIHRVGVIHRDLKPGNVIIAEDGPRVIDFGVARAIEEATAALTQTGMRVGTPAYMAPEQVQGLPLDPAGDVFALGSTAYYAATGRPPFGVDQAVFHRIETKEPDWSWCPAQVRDVLAHCLRKDPADRPTPAEVIELCRQVAPVALPYEGDGDRGGAGTDVGWLPLTVVAEITRYQLAPLPEALGVVDPAAGSSFGQAGPAVAPRPGTAGTTDAEQTAPAASGRDGPLGRAGGQRRRRSRGRTPWLVGGLGTAVLLGLVVLLMAMLAGSSGSDNGEGSDAAAVVATSEPDGGDTGTADGSDGRLPGPAKSGGLGAPGAATLGAPIVPSGPPATAPAGAGQSVPPGGATPSAAPPAPVPAVPGPAVPPPAAPPPVATTPATTGCPGSPNHTYNGDGAGVLVEASPLRTGPDADCRTVTTIATGKKVWLWCSVINSHNNVWWWVRLEGTETYGWMWDGNLKIDYVDDNDDGRTRTYSCSGTFVDH